MYLKWRNNRNFHITVFSFSPSNLLYLTWKEKEQMRGKINMNPWNDGKNTSRFILLGQNGKPNRKAQSFNLNLQLLALMLMKLLVAKLSTTNKHPPKTLTFHNLSFPSLIATGA